MELVCIVCPNGCHLSVEQSEDKVTVIGAKCNRGIKFGETEVTNPTRTLTSSVKSTVDGYNVVSVKTNGEIPKKLLFDVMRELSKVTLDTALPLGAVVISNILETGVDIVTTSAME
ncbi:MAG: DUF1667 domain-containing protein [Clostridia bacterium]